MHKSQCRNVKQHVNIFPSKDNSTTKDLNNGKEKKISNIKLQKNNKKNELKEETQNLVSGVKENINK
jgi:hypothetical protein